MNEYLKHVVGNLYITTLDFGYVNITFAIESKLFIGYTNGFIKSNITDFENIQRNLWNYTSTYLKNVKRMRGAIKIRRLLSSEITDIRISVIMIIFVQFLRFCGST